MANRKSRRMFQSSARKYLTTDRDGILTVAAAAMWLSTVPLTAGLSDAQRRALVVALRAEDRVAFAVDDDDRMIKLVEVDGSPLGPLTILAGLSLVAR